MFMRTDGLDKFARISRGQGNTEPEAYTLHQPTDVISTGPIFSGSKAYLKSSLTGKYCRVASLKAATTTQACQGTLGLLCDQVQPVAATLLTVTPSGFTFNGMSFVESSDGLLVLSSDPACVPVGSGPSYTFAPVNMGRYRADMAHALADASR